MDSVLLKRESQKGRQSALEVRCSALRKAEALRLLNLGASTGRTGVQFARTAG